MTLVPGVAPRTDIGSFEIVENNENREVYLYWQAIPQNQENGDNLKYQIVHVEEIGHNVVLTSNEMARNTLSWRKSASTATYSRSSRRIRSELIVPRDPRNRSPDNDVSLTRKEYAANNRYWNFFPSTA